MGNINWLWWVLVLSLPFAVHFIANPRDRRGRPSIWLTLILSAGIITLGGIIAVLLTIYSVGFSAFQIDELLSDNFWLLLTSFALAATAIGFVFGKRFRMHPPLFILAAIVWFLAWNYEGVLALFQPSG